MGQAKREGLLIREATPEDAPALLAIYAPYVRETAISFELVPPSEEEFRRRIASTLERYPYLVAERAPEPGGAPLPVGYAYVGPFHEREAYRTSAETSIYVAADERGHGVGRALYDELERRCAAAGICNLYACVAYASAPDAHLTNASAAFHEALGYRLVGRFEKCARKFGTWYDMVYLEKFVAPHE
ncbi:N-acetyltransferase family protein [Olsenella sp. YH-ols2223]|uniref:N-acetyltransferase family protein n=1 Tax=Olsenella absiana TaxID=3115222 RepID=A0ABU7R8E1_9ACTN